MGFAAHAPGAAHLGNLTTYLFIDEQASPEQRAALTTMMRGEAGGVFGIFASLTTTMIGPEFLPIEWHFDGPRSRARAGDRIDYGVELIKNPVTGEESGFTLKFTNGLLTDEAELMKSTVFRVSHPELSYDHSGQYGETFRFNFTGGGE